MQQVNYKHPLSKQRGVSLIEVLVSLVLMAVIGLGAALIAGRTAVLHRDQNVHLHTINQMRDQLESSQCITSGTKTITVAGQSVNLDCTYTEGSYTVIAKDASNNIFNGIASSASGAIKVKSPTLKVQDSDTFAPVKSEIKP